MGSIIYSFRASARGKIRPAVKMLLAHGMSLRTIEIVHIIFRIHHYYWVPDEAGMIIMLAEPSLTTESACSTIIPGEVA
ncbi:MAG: hypothetical protein H8D34_34210 [Chloroflexi bacterium]|nr:hypothetical protein [Chloroflexota bacterium]